MTMPESELDEFSIHGGDPELKAQWDKVKFFRDRNRHNVEVLAQLNTRIDAGSVILSRLNLLITTVLDQRQQIEFELTYEEKVNEQLVKAQSEARKAILAAPNLSPVELDRLVGRLDQFQNGNHPPQTPGGLYTGRG